MLKTKNSLWFGSNPLPLLLCLQSSPFTIYISSVLCLNSSVSQGLVLSSLFLLCSMYRHSSLQFQVTILHYPYLNLWYRFGLLACWFTPFELKILELRDLLFVAAAGKSSLYLTDNPPWFCCCTLWTRISFMKCMFV